MDERNDIINEQKKIQDELNKLLLESRTENNILKEQIVLLERNSFFLEHNNRVLKEKAQHKACSQ